MPRPPIIFACANFPWPLHQGVKLRLYHIIHALAAIYDVHFVVMTDASQALLDESTLESVCKSVNLVPLSSAYCRQFDTFPTSYPKRLARLYQLLFDRFPFMIQDYRSSDYVSVLRALREKLGDAPAWADTAPCAEMALEAGFSRVLVDYDDIESEQSARSLKLLPWRPYRVLAMADVVKTRRYERTMPSRFSTVVIARADDRRHFRRNTTRIHVVPNGVVHTKEIGSASSMETLLFIGSFGWGPNSEAVEWMARAVMPLIRAKRSTVRFVAVGQRGDDGWARRMRALGAEIHESVESVLPFYSEATVIVAPLKRGSGTKLKVLEAMMLGRPILATRVAMEGIEARHDDAVLIADSPEDFAAAALRLLDDAELRDRLKARARSIAETNYSWETIRPSILSAAAAISLSARC